MCVVADLSWLGEGTSALLRPYLRTERLEWGIFGTVTRRAFEVTTVGEEEREVSDIFYRSGMDVVYQPQRWFELSALGYMAWHRNPTGTDQRARFAAGYIQTEWSIHDHVAAVARYEYTKYLSNLR